MLEKFIQTQIKKQGLISFSQFMEWALYHPDWGYYSKNKTSPDYYTNVNVHPIFSQILANYFANVWRREFPDEKEIVLVELGCGNGTLAQKILDWIQRDEPEFFNRLTYVGIERSPARSKQFLNLKSRFGNKINPGSVSNMEQKPVTGIIFSNEFFDALPFDRVIKRDGSLYEIRVGSSFQETMVPASKQISDYFRWLGAEPQEDCIGEVHLTSRDWSNQISKSLKKGVILTIDYGFDANELYSEHRTEGTALCHANHTVNKNFYRSIGNQDITAHVNFTTLRKEAESLGIHSLPLKSQSQFLLENGLARMVEAKGIQKDPRSELKISSAIRSLIHPEGMGGTFKVLVQQRI